MIGEQFPIVSKLSRQSLKSYNPKFVTDKCASNNYGVTLNKIFSRNPVLCETPQRSRTTGLIFLGFYAQGEILFRFCLARQKNSAKLQNGLSLVYRDKERIMPKADTSRANRTRSARARGREVAPGSTAKLAGNEKRMTFRKSKRIAILRLISCAGAGKM